MQDLAIRIVLEGLLLEILRYSTEPSNKNDMAPTQKQTCRQMEQIQDPNMSSVQVTITISYLTKFQNHTLEENRIFNK